MVGTEGEDEEFEFYLKFAKPLVLNLPDTNDRIKAAAWIRYLKRDQSDLALRGEYLKLLLFVLQRRKLYGPFSVIPKDGEPLPKFPEDINIQDVAKNFIEIDKKILKSTLERGGYGEWPPYNVACSSDLTEYAVSQEIPGFGVHAFCAFSRDPLPVWNHFERAIFPIGENVNTTKPECPLVDTASPDISCFVSPEKKDPSAPLESPRRSPRIPPGGPKDKTPPSDVAPKSPPKEPSPFKEDEFGIDDRVPPTWGSNLVEVKDLSLETSVLSPLKELDIEVSEQDMLDFFNDDIDLYDADLDEATSYLQGDFYSPGSKPGSAGTPGPPEEDICPSAGGPCPADTEATPGTPVHYSPQLPEDYVTSPHKMFDMLQDLASDKDMLDFYYDTSPKLPEDDPAFYLQGEKFDSPEMLAIEPPPVTPSRTPMSPGVDFRHLEQRAVGMPLPPSPEAPCATSPEQGPTPCSPGPSQASPCVTIRTPEEEGLGGDSFMESGKKEFRWLSDVSPGPGLPEDEEQDPALWESFGWWTEDRDEIFQYLSPSPRAKGTPVQDPYEKERERWGEAVRTPPIFSKDPKIREGPAAQRQYTIDEFGMESFEEPVWTSAEQYLKYTIESPYKNLRDINRKAYDPADYPKIPTPEMSRRLTDIQGEPEEAAFFQESLSPELVAVTLGDEDLQPLTKVEAMMEAIRHGPQFIGVPTPEPEPTPETPKEDSGEWEDMRFIEETPPLFMMEPPFLATPPGYDPNPNIEVDELDEDTVGRYIEEDLKLINAMIPATTPQRAPSPKRPPPMTAESPPFVPDIEVEPEPYIPSPGPVPPERYVVPPQRTVDWDTNIGSPIKLPETNAVVIVSETELLEQNIKRKQELAVIYERQFESPPKIPTPPAMPHLMDDPIPGRRLPQAMSPEKLPPPGWDWKTPEQYKRKPYVPKVKRTPTGISPPKPIPKELTMFHESPPEQLYSPDFYDDINMADLEPPQFSPRTPTPPRRSPHHTIPVVSYSQKDIIDRELQEPSGYDLGDIVLHQIPDIELSPEVVEEFDQSEIQDLQQQIFPSSVAAAQHVVISPRKKTPPPEPKVEEAPCVCSEPELPTQKKSKGKPGSKTQKLKTPVPPTSKSTSKTQLPAKGKKPPTTKLPEKASTSRSKIPPKQAGTCSTKGPCSDKCSAAKKTEKESSSKTRIQPPGTSKSRIQPPGSAKSRIQPPGSSKSRIQPSGAKEPPSGPSSRSRIPSRSGLKPPSKSKLAKPQARQPAPVQVQEVESELEREIRMLESEVFEETSRRLPIRPTAPEYSPPTPEYQRKLWRQQLEMHQEVPYPRKAFVVKPKPGKSVRVQKYKYRPQLSRIPDSLADIPAREPIGSPEHLFTPERRAWRERVRGHEPTAMRRKIFYVRPKPGRAVALTGMKIPSLSPVHDTSPVDQEDLEREIAELEAELFQEQQRSPERAAIVQDELDQKIAELEDKLFQEEAPQIPEGVTVESLNEEIARLEQELQYLSTPPRRGGPDYSPETPPITRDIWRESLRQYQMAPYRERSYARQPPDLETILSPRHPDFAAWERDRYLDSVRRQAEIAVELDKMQIIHPERSSEQDTRPAYHEMSEAERQYWQSRRYEFQVPSPEPPEPIVIDDSPEPQPQGGVPEGWSWKTPEKYVREPYVPRQRRVPTGISPPRPIPPELTMFHESPPEEFYEPEYVDEDDIDMGMLAPPQFSPVRSPQGAAAIAPPQFSPRRTPPPPSAPPRMAVPQSMYWQKDAIDRELQLPAEADDLESIALEDIPDIELSPEQLATCPGAQALSPEAQALREAVQTHTRTKPKKPSTFLIWHRGKVQFRRVQKPRAPSLSTIPDPDTSPPGAKTREELIREINELYLKSRGKFPLRKVKPFPYDPNSPPTPPVEKRCRGYFVKYHDMRPYTKQRQRAQKKPALDTIFSPRHPEFEGLQEEQQIRDVDRFHQRRLEADMQAIEEEQRRELFEHSERHRTRVASPYDGNELAEYWQTRRFDFNVPSPPEEVLSPQPPPHLLDESLPEDLPQALLPPSDWTWRTPERFIRKPYVPKEKPVPSGISPPRPIPPELTMFHESPPQELYSPEMFDDDIDMAALAPPEFSPARSPPPQRSPQGAAAMVPSYFQSDVIDRELIEPTDLDDVEFPELPDDVLSPEEPREISPGREAWRQTVRQSAPLKRQRKIFHIRPKHGRAIALTGVKIPNLSPVADTSPPEARIKEEPQSSSEEMPNEVIERLDRQIAELEAELNMLRTPPRHISSTDETTPETPEYERKMWSEMVRLHERRDLPRGKKVSREPDLATVFSPRHPDFEELQRERHISDMRLQAARVVQMDIERLKQEKERDLYTLSQQHQERVQYEMPEAEREYWRTRRYDIDVPSPPPPEPEPQPPVHILDEDIPQGLPRGLSVPPGWSYRTPPRLKYRVPEERKVKTPTGIASPKLPPLGSLFYESPPLISPEESPESLTPSPPRQQLQIARPPSPIRSPGGRPIAPYIPPVTSDLEAALYYPTEYDEMGIESPPDLYMSPEHLPLEYEEQIPADVPTPESVSQAEMPNEVIERLDRQIAELEAELNMLRTPPEDLEGEIANLEAEVFAAAAGPSRRLRIRTPSPEYSPPTPEHQRRLWRQQLEMHEDVPYYKSVFSVKPKPGRSVRVAKFSHRPRLHDVEERYYEVSPVSPPLKPRPLEDINLPLPVVTVPPENWTWKTPSPLTRRGIYAESPPLVYSPPSPPSPGAKPPTPVASTSVFSPRQQDVGTIDLTTPEGIIDLTSPSPRATRRSPSPRPMPLMRTPTPMSVSTFRRPGPPSPLRSPGGRPVLQGLQERPLDAFELAQAVPQDFETIDLTSPYIDLTSPYIDLTSPYIDLTSPYIDLTSPEPRSPPVPPPKPETPRAWIAPARRVHGQRAPLDPNVLYGTTPASARQGYEPLPETIRFESSRPVTIQPTTPEVPKGYYETPMPPATRPYRKRRKIINRQSPRRRLQFGAEEEEPVGPDEERLKILELQAQLLARSPPRDVMAESPPDFSPETELLGDLVYEPPVFNLYVDEDAPDYEVRPAFAGQPESTYMDTSPIETVERIPMHLRDFRWMDSSCGSECPWDRH